MTAYRYRAADAAGKEQIGMIEADTARLARAKLREQNLFPIDVDAFGENGEGSSSGARGFGRRLSTTQLCLLTRQWATLLLAGLTVEQALSALIDQSDQPRVRQILAMLRSELLGGYSLSVALDRFPRVFPPIYRATIGAGEKSGELAVVLSELADHLENQAQLARKTLQALLYPIIVAVVALLVVGGLMVHVVPQVVTVFQQSKQQLPWLTRALIVASDMLRQWGWVALLSFSGGGIAAYRLLQQEGPRLAFDRWLLRLPLLGRQLREVDGARLAGTLAILTRSRVPLLTALEAGTQVVALLPLKNAVKAAATSVSEGQNLAKALAAGHCFPPLLIHLTANGEATGRLDDMLARSAQLLGREAENRMATLTTLLEPAMLLGMGGIVLTIVLAVMEPIIELNHLMH
jgi:general secretion pathway protein F